jgi:hypothetical protein
LTPVKRNVGWIIQVIPEVGNPDLHETPPERGFRQEEDLREEANNHRPSWISNTRGVFKYPSAFPFANRASTQKD